MMTMSRSTTSMIKFKEVPMWRSTTRQPVPMNLIEFCEVTRTLARIKGQKVANAYFTKYVDLDKIELA